MAGRNGRRCRSRSRDRRLFGALTEAGVSKKRRRYAEGVRPEATLVSAKVNDADRARLEAS